jgi:hypothetical protein
VGTLVQSREGSRAYRRLGAVAAYAIADRESQASKMKPFTVVRWLGDSKVTDESWVHFRKMPLPRVVTDEGKVNVPSEVHSMNAQAPILRRVARGSKVTVANAAHPSKQRSPMTRTVFGTARERSFGQWKKQTE